MAQQEAGRRSYTAEQKAEAVALAHRIAPVHLELSDADPEQWAAGSRHAARKDSTALTHKSCTRMRPRHCAATRLPREAA